MNNPSTWFCVFYMSLVMALDREQSPRLCTYPKRARQREEMETDDD